MDNRFSQPEDISPNQARAELAINGYAAAVQFYNQELNTISQRNTAFLIVQSILVAAFATLLINAGQFPWALAIFMWALSVGGSLFCFFHHLTGRSGAQAAAKWRRYMRSAEMGQVNGPWNRFDEYSMDKHNNHINIPKKRHVCLWLRNLNSRLQCDKCLVQRLPLPHAWITNPSIFALGWILAASYLTRRLFIEGDPLHTNPFLPLPIVIAISIVVLLVTIYFLGYIIRHCITWWHMTIPET